MLNRDKTRSIVDALVKLRGLATDAQAAEVPVLYPEWKVGIEYKAEERVLYKGVLYKVVMAHISQEAWTPDAAPSLFAKVLIPDENKIYPWEQPESTNGYMTGDKVLYEDKIWISIVDNNVWRPGEYGWEEVIEEPKEEPTDEPTEEPTEEPTDEPKEESNESAAWVQPDSTNPYSKDSKVSHNDKIWISIVDNNVWEPGIYGWEEVIE